VLFRVLELVAAMLVVGCDVLVQSDWYLMSLFDSEHGLVEMLIVSVLALQPLGTLEEVMAEVVDRVVEAVGVLHSSS
jgi:hypothetical protein